jgi:hypothetical protein
LKDAVGSPWVSLVALGLLARDAGGRYSNTPAADQFLVKHFHPGEFLSDRLPSADVLIFGRVLHNWDLPTKRVLLAKAHEAVTPGGALIVYERFIDDDRQSSAAGLLASPNMLVMTSGGFEISAAECTGLMREAGFGSLQTHTLGGDQRMVIGFTAKS